MEVFQRMMDVLRRNPGERVTRAQVAIEIREALKDMLHGGAFASGAVITVQAEPEPDNVDEAC
jgi:molybdenum cofactor biosynthesis enzyme